MPQGLGAGTCSLFWYHMLFWRAVCHLSDSAAVQAARLWSHHPDIVVSLLKRCKGAIVGGVAAVWGPAAPGAFAWLQLGQTWLAGAG